MVSQKSHLEDEAPTDSRLPGQSCSSGEDTARNRGAILAHRVPNQSIVNEALDPRRRTLAFEEPPSRLDIFTAIEEPSGSATKSVRSMASNQPTPPAPSSTASSLTKNTGERVSSSITNGNESMVPLTSSAQEETTLVDSSQQAITQDIIPNLRKSSMQRAPKRPTTPPNRYSHSGGRVIPSRPTRNASLPRLGCRNEYSVTGDDASPGSNNELNNTAISPQCSPSRRQSPAEKLPNLSAEFSPIVGRKKTAARNSRCRWYDGSYVNRVKHDDEYLCMEEMFRVERFYVRQSPLYITTSISQILTPLNILELKARWCQIIEQRRHELKQTKKTGFQPVTDSIARIVTKHDATSRHHGDWHSPSSPVEQHLDERNDFGNAESSSGLMRREMLPPGSADDITLSETIKAAARMHEKRSHSPWKSPWSKRAKPHRIMDKCTRLLESTLGEREYAKIYEPAKKNGSIPTTPDLPSDAESPLEITAIYNLDLLRTEQVELRNNASDRSGKRPELLCLHWLADEKIFLVSHNNVNVKGTNLPVKQIVQVHYGATPPRLHIEYRAVVQDGDTEDHHNMHLILDCTSVQYTILKGTLSRQVGGMKVNRADSAYLDKMLQELEKLAAKGERKTMKSSAQTLSEQNNDNAEVADSNLTKEDKKNEKSMAGDTSLPPSPSDDKSVSSSKAPQKSPRQQENPTEHVALSRAASNRGSEPSQVIGPPAGSIDSESTQEPGISLDTTDMTSPLRYRSGHVVAIGDVVVRLRDSRTITNGPNKLDKYDIFDGPYIVLKVPTATFVRRENQSKWEFGQVMTKTVKGTNTTIDNESNSASVTERKKMLETLIKLRFPKNSANPWTTLGRLIPVTEFEPEAPKVQDEEVRNSVDRDEVTASLFATPAIHPRNIAQRGAKKIVRLPDDTSSHSNIEEPMGMVKLSESVHVAVQYVAPNRLTSEGHYEVGKLRGKRLRRLQGEEAKGLKTEVEDSWVRRYIKSKGSPKKGEVLVVEYLVHWSGWPSERDTWERGKDNIPDAFIREYAERADPYRDRAEKEEEILSDPERLFPSIERRRESTKRKASDGSSDIGRSQQTEQTTAVDSNAPVKPGSLSEQGSKKEEKKLKKARIPDEPKHIEVKADEGKN